MSFFAELKRRNVVRVGLAYVVIGWLLAQVAELAFDVVSAPDWVLKSILIVLLLGLPLALFFAWAFEITPEGVKLEKHVDRSQSITAQTGRKLDFIIIGVLVLAVGFLLADRFYFNASPEPDEVVLTVGRQSIAVLSFVNISDDNDHFADGLSEELLNLLAKIPDLKVAARTSSFAFKGRNEDMRQVGDTLGVKTVLEGSVRRSGDRLRVTAQLINVDDGFHLWSETYDRRMADIFDIQDEVAGAITDALKLHLAPASDKPTESPEAYAIYLEALAQVDSSDFQDVIDLLDRAIRLDPKFAKAYELKASVYWFAAATALEASTAQSLIYEAATQAIELEPSLVLARSFTKSANPDTWNWVSEFQALEDANRADPDNVRILSVWVYDLNFAGYFQEALQVGRRIIELDPLSPVGYINTGEAYEALGRRADALETYARMRDIGHNEFEATNQAFSYFAAGDFEAGVTALGDWSINGMNGQTLREFIENATDPESGLEFLRSWVDQVESNSGSYAENNSAKYWFLFLGYLDDYWREIEVATPELPSSWSNVEYLEFLGIIFHANGFRRHPSFIPHQTKYEMIELWESRGAPDTCSKKNGRWVCE